MLKLGVQNSVENVSQIAIVKRGKPPGREGQLPFPYLGRRHCYTLVSRVPEKVRFADKIQQM